MKGFLKNRPLRGELRDELTRKDPRIGEKLARGLQAPIRALSLTSHISLSTAFNNDVDSELGFAQQLLGLGDAGDTLIAISTSGNAANVNNAVMLASVLGIGTIGLTGEGGGSLATLTDICIRVPEQETFMIQELHLPVYHALCSMLEEHFFEE
jgi:D-sedoheptulose 7-phosphate isomerase